MEKPEPALITAFKELLWAWDQLHSPKDGVAVDAREAIAAAEQRQATEHIKDRLTTDELATIKHEGNCRFWDDEEFCTCGAEAWQVSCRWKKSAIHWEAVSNAMEPEYSISRQALSVALDLIKAKDAVDLSACREKALNLVAESTGERLMIDAGGDGWALVLIDDPDEGHLHEAVDWVQKNCDEYSIYGAAYQALRQYFKMRDSVPVDPPTESEYPADTASIAKDAERYRFLRGHGAITRRDAPGHMFDYGTGLDAVVDEKMLKQQREQLP